MATATVNGLTINYEIIGTHGPFVALMPGGRRSYREFVPLANKLAGEGFRVLLHDRRNTGTSEMSIAGQEVEEAIWADDLHELLRQLGGLPAFVGGSSSGARTSILFGLRHKASTLGLLLFRVTGGAFAAERLPENYYGQFIRVARDGGMAAVCATDQYRERIEMNPGDREMLMNMDAKTFIAVMTRWRDYFLERAHEPVLGVTEAELATLAGTPTIVIPGNDKVHNSASGRTAHKLIPGSELHELPIADQDVVVVPFEDWGPLEPEIVRVFSGFMRRHEARRAA
ncbi:MAG: alpha/beta fold hydrolase [Alphaproteobacteria bacterium]